jgi:hypothetical protein
MGPAERTRFLVAIGEAAKLLKQAQAELQLARVASDGEVHEQADLLCKRAYEMQVKVEWLRHVALGNIRIDLARAEADSRHGADRRRGIDRRIASLREQILLKEP